jgi:hypothetical protein
MNSIVLLRVCGMWGKFEVGYKGRFGGFGGADRHDGLSSVNETHRSIRAA